MYVSLGWRRRQKKENRVGILYYSYTTLILPWCSIQLTWIHTMANIHDHSYYRTSVLVRALSHIKYHPVCPILKAKSFCSTNHLMPVTVAWGTFAVQTPEPLELQSSKCKFVYRHEDRCSCHKLISVYAVFITIVKWLYKLKALNLSYINIFQYY